VVNDDRHPVSILTRIDLLHFLLQRQQSDLAATAG
jgi:hypothetical protein